MSFAVTGTVLAVGGAAYGARQSRNAAREVARGADAATAEGARQFDLTRADTASGRSLYEGANAILGRQFGIPVTTSQQSQYDDGELVLSQNGVPMMDANRYANDPAYRFAWDKTLAAERANPLWRRQDQQTFYARATDADWNRINSLMGQNLAEYRAQNPQAAPQAGGTAGQPSMDDFFASPSYNFRRSEGTRDIQNTFAARGGGQSGNALRRLNEFNSNLASGEYGNWLDSVFRAAGLGSNAVNTSVNAGENFADRAGRNALIAGDARASGIADRTNAITGGVQNIAGLWGYLGGRKRPQTNYAFGRDI